MRRVILFLLLALPSYELAANNCSCWEMQARAAYFYPASRLFRKIYPGARIIYQIEASKSLKHGVSAWFNGSWLPKSGHSTPLHNYTRIDLVPLSFGLNLMHHVDCNFSMYMGLGVAGTWLRIRDHSPFVIKNTSKWNVGGVGKVGIRYNFCGCFFLDFFADYLYQPYNFKNRNKCEVFTRHNVNAGGYSTGLGVGGSY